MRVNELAATGMTGVGVFNGVVGGAEGIRTPCLFNAIEALSQMSYSPTQAPIILFI